MAAQVRSSGFGVAIRFDANPNLGDIVISVDDIPLIIHFTEAAPTSGPSPAQRVIVVAS